jgi:hypothetical protein
VKRRQIAIGVAIFTWGIAFPMCADQSSDADFRGNAIGSTFVPYGKLSLSLPLQSGQNLSLGAVAEAPAGGASASALNKELSNPVSSLWSISNQARRGQGREIWAFARQASARGAVHAGASPYPRPGVERAGPDHPCPPEAYKGHPVRVMQKEWVRLAKQPCTRKSQ